MRGTISTERDAQLRRALWYIPEQADLFLSEYQDIMDVLTVTNFAGFLYMGRGPNLASALEGALKIKKLPISTQKATLQVKWLWADCYDRPIYGNGRYSHKGRTYEKVLSTCGKSKQDLGDHSHSKHA